MTTKNTTKPWDQFPIDYPFGYNSDYKGYSYLILQNPRQGYLCGYIFVGESEDVDAEAIRCHGGITFDGELDGRPGRRAIGFHCANFGDLCPFAYQREQVVDDEIWEAVQKTETWRNLAFVKKECESVIDQLTAPDTGERIFYEREATEEEFLSWYKKQDWPSYDRPSYTADMIALRYKEGRLQIPLVRRAAHPFKDFYALPGGFVNSGESGKEAVIRELKEETGLEVAEKDVHTIDTFDRPGRDPRGWVVTKAHVVFLNPNVEWLPEAGDDASDVYWADFDPSSGRVFVGGDTLELAFDHGEILLETARRLQGWARWNPQQLSLLGECFTAKDAVELLNKFLVRPLKVNNFSRDYDEFVADTGSLRYTGKRPAREFSLR